MTPKPTSGFTDEDVARLKEEMRKCPDYTNELTPHIQMPITSMKALLARLEVAEKVIQIALTIHPELMGWTEAWCKACGK